jgi:hypothetical protein
LSADGQPFSDIEMNANAVVETVVTGKLTCFRKKRGIRDGSSTFDYPHLECSYDRVIHRRRKPKIISINN